MSDYIHGFTADEQSRLTRMQELLNESELAALELEDERRILDVGAGLGQMARLMARGSDRRVLGIERDPRQLEEAQRQAREAGEGELIELREGSATDLPLSAAERGSFDLAHARFLLEHVPDPQAVVNEMASAVRPGGRVVLIDDDHDQLRFHPPLPQVELAWEIYWKSYELLDCDPLIGRRLPELLVAAGLKLTRVTTIFYGECQGGPLFEAIVDNLVGVLSGAEELLDREGLLSKRRMGEALEAFQAWRKEPAAVVWYSIPLAEARR